MKERRCGCDDYVGSASADEIFVAAPASAKADPTELRNGWSFGRCVNDDPPHDLRRRGGRIADDPIHVLSDQAGRQIKWTDDHRPATPELQALEHKPGGIGDMVFGIAP